MMAAQVHAIAARSASEARANKSWRLQRNLTLRQQAAELPRRFAAPGSAAAMSAAQMGGDGEGVLAVPASPAPASFSASSSSSSSSSSGRGDRKGGGSHHSFDEQIAIFQTEFSETTQLLFHAYEPLLIAADGRDRIGLWNYEEGERINVFANLNPRGSRVSALHLLNDLHVSMLMTGSDDGVVRLAQRGGERVSDRSYL
jgi:hypothetical protein